MIEIAKIENNACTQCGVSVMNWRADDVLTHIINHWSDTVLASFAGSFKGRTPGFGPEGAGSIPAPASIFTRFDHQKVFHVFEAGYSYCICHAVGRDGDTSKHIKLYEDGTVQEVEAFTFVSCEPKP